MKSWSFLLFSRQERFGAIVAAVPEREGSARVAAEHRPYARREEPELHAQHEPDALEVDHFHRASIQRETFAIYMLRSPAFDLVRFGVLVDVNHLSCNITYTVSNCKHMFHRKLGR